MITREDLVSIARVAAIGRVDNAMALDPDEWVLESMRRAYERGRRDADVPEPMFASTHNQVESENTGRG